MNVHTLLYTFILPCPLKSWNPPLSWNFLVKIGENFKNIRFTPLEIRGTVTDISD